MSSKQGADRERSGRADAARKRRLQNKEIIIMDGGIGTEILRRGANWASHQIQDDPGLVRAVDLIGRLADPDHPRKLAALFHKFEETGANARIGYATPEDVREGYPKFYWNMVNPYIGPGLEYLKATRQCRQWQASLFSHIFAEEPRQAR